MRASHIYGIILGPKDLDRPRVRRLAGSPPPQNFDSHHEHKLAPGTLFLPQPEASAPPARTRLEQGVHCSSVEGLRIENEAVAHPIQEPAFLGALRVGNRREQAPP